MFVFVIQCCNAVDDGIAILIGIIKKKSLTRFLIKVEKSFTDEKLYLRKSGGKSNIKTFRNSLVSR